MAKKDDIQKLDQRITTLQSNLFDLYRQRQELFSGSKNYSAALRAATSITAASADKWYDQLKAEWATREVTIPAKSRLIRKIKAGLLTIEQLAQEYGVAPEVFTLVLIPPHNIYSNTELEHDRLMQPHVRYADSFDVKPSAARSRDWRLLAVYDGLEGADFGSAAEIMDSRAYVAAGLDVRALGVREYQIYALRHNGQRDTAWTWLLNDDSHEPWSVRFMSGAYHFTRDDALGLGQGELFRPSVEIV